ncbi:MAG: polyamine aminopropyltransferase [Ichthyobacteriaceae bacterium]|nr:polyamine aminopropyltransferase [Ichthyobacteriaceae bacterium]
MDTKQVNQSYVLKIALFLTGISGIVAEYVLSTLASYFLGNSIVQWTMILSIMLFSMGLGSRLSQMIKSKLIEKLIIIEFTLSILTSLSALTVYTISAFTEYTGFFIYLLSIAIGTLIGLEIPIVTRINEQYEPLRVNIASVMEKDYFGSLVGGVFFAFVGLPYLGISYTPFVLGVTNFVVAIWLLMKMKNTVELSGKLSIYLFGVFVSVLLFLGFIYTDNIILFGEQRKYKDRIVFEEQSKYQKITITQWKNDYWLYINGNEQLSTFDEFLYHEPLVHPVMQLAKEHNNILILGGGDGFAVNELLKYKDVKHITMVDLDPAMTNLGKNNPIMTKFNNNSMSSPKLKIINTDGFNFLENTSEFYDVIIIDLPDPKSIELNKLYTKEFYQIAKIKLRTNGLLITQAGSPYYATEAFKCIEKTMKSAKLNTLPLHNQVLTLGEWGWIIGSKHLTSDKLKSKLRKINFDNIETRWINNEAMLLITSFGKDFIELETQDINTINNPVLYQYYLNGNWELY